MNYQSLNKTCNPGGVTKLIKHPFYQHPSDPGKITGRSCAYFGARWVLAPLKDAIHLVHGTAGCAYYGSTVRAKSYRLFSTALEEKDVVFGGEEKLAGMLIEAKTIMPEAKYILVYITCSPALIGDDVNSICKRMEKRLGCPVVLVDCPGFKGQSESAGHRIAYESILQFIPLERCSVRNNNKGVVHRGKISNGVNIIGQYNVNETKIIKSLLSKMGLNVHCVFTADAPYEKIITAYRVKLNLVICQNSGQFFAEAMRKDFGIPYLKVSFLGLSQSIDSLRRIGRYFGLKKEAEAVINEEYKAIQPQLTQFLLRLKGKKAAVFLGAARIADLVKIFDSLGMKVTFVGSRFANSVDYRNIKRVAKACPVRDRLSLDNRESLNGANLNRKEFSNGVGVHIIDDPSEQNLEDLFSKLKPDVLVVGAKEQSLGHKFGIGSVLPQLGAYVGFKGFMDFAKNIYKAIYAPVWRFLE